MKILVTGNLGYIGSVLTDYLVEFGFEVIGSVGDVFDRDDLVLEVRVVLHVRDRAHVVHVRQVEELRLGRVALRAAETVARESHVSLGSSPRPRSSSPSSTR